MVYERICGRFIVLGIFPPFKVHILSCALCMKSILFMGFVSHETVISSGLGRGLAGPHWRWLSWQGGGWGVRHVL